MSINMQTEPIAIFAAVEIALIAILGAVAVAFEWDSEVVVSIGGLVTATILVLTTILQRKRVDSPATVAEKVDAALNTTAP